MATTCECSVKTLCAEGRAGVGTNPPGAGECWNAPLGTLPPPGPPVKKEPPRTAASVPPPRGADGRGPRRRRAAGRELSRLRLIQHKTEAYWFYRFLSIVYDVVVNPGHWTEDMREDALAAGDLGPGQKVCDIGGGTGFSTIGIVRAGVEPANITLMDQSDHQLAKAARKEELRGVTILTGDAEDIPLEVSARRGAGGAGAGAGGLTRRGPRRTRSTGTCPAGASSTGRTRSGASARRTGW